MPYIASMNNSMASPAVVILAVVIVIVILAVAVAVTKSTPDSDATPPACKTSADCPTTLPYCGADDLCHECTLSSGKVSTGCSAPTAFCYTDDTFAPGAGTCAECGFAFDNYVSQGCSESKTICAPFTYASKESGPGTCAQCFSDGPITSSNLGIGCAASFKTYQPGSNAFGVCVPSGGTGSGGPGVCADCIVDPATGDTIGCQSGTCKPTSGTSGPGKCG
jgi:hypothetical protein